MTRSAQRGLSGLVLLFLTAVSIGAVAGCGKKEEPASATPSTPPQYTTPEGSVKSAMPGGGPPKQAPQGQ